jgi:hypothetical protein
MIAMKPLQFRRFAMTMIWLRLPKMKGCLAIAAPKTNRLLLMDC